MNPYQRVHDILFYGSTATNDLGLLQELLQHEAAKYQGECSETDDQLIARWVIDQLVASRNPTTRAFSDFAVSTLQQVAWPTGRV